ncbi:MAG TPA: hypothetical protein VIW24_08615 [Aldersonia sp.]
MAERGRGDDADESEWCGLRRSGGSVHLPVHQVRKLAALGDPGPGQPEWAALMARKRRKTLVVCHTCHEAIHDGHATADAA